MKYEINGVVAQNVDLDLEFGEYCYITPGGMISYIGDLDWTVGVPGGMKGAINRMLSGETLRMTIVKSGMKGGRVSFNNNMPGKVFPWDLNSGEVIATRGAFIGAVGKIDIKVTIAKKAGAMFFGGAGLVLQTISGQGTAFIHGAGDFIVYDLQPGESLKVSTGNLAAFAKTVDYDIQSVGDLKKMVLGSEGLFMTKLTGPGKVLLQSMKHMGVNAAMAAASAMV